MPTITPPAVPFPAPIDSSPLLDKVREMAKPPSDDSKGEDTKRLTMIDPGPKTPADKTGTSRYVYDENAEKYPPVKDGKVGGVRLRGAGAALKDLGPLTGVAVDDNGRLVLLAADAPDVHLPPLRLDDIVTVFRCVYDHGEAPSVSIDPDPADEEGVRVHTVRHGKGTEDTYVGWVLFEADRVMKSYVVGMDTITKDRVHSRVPGYMDKMDLAFYYWDEESGRGSSRYRNWIVPAEVVRKRSGDRRLTLLDVPLKVRTERTAVRDGKLVDAPELGRSKSALAFVDWFSKNYDEIAKEAYSLPPRESGIDHPAPVFEELRRVALMSAVAEALHDQGGAVPRLDARLSRSAVPHAAHHAARPPRGVAQGRRGDAELEHLGGSGAGADRRSQENRGRRQGGQRPGARGVSRGRGRPDAGARRVHPGGEKIPRRGAAGRRHDRTGGGRPRRGRSGRPRRPRRLPAADAPCQLLLRPVGLPGQGLDARPAAPGGVHPGDSAYGKDGVHKKQVAADQSARNRLHGL